MGNGGWKIRDQDGIYFVTFTTVQWVDVFTRLQHRLAIVESLEYCQKSKGLIIYAWVIMSNHLHLIIQSNGEFPLSSIIRDFKKYTSVRIKKQIGLYYESRRSWMKWIFETAGKENKNNRNFQLWQQRSHPIHLHSKLLFKRCLNYLHNNPVKAGIVLESHQYLYSSASNYADMGGLIKVKVLLL